MLAGLVKGSDCFGSHERSRAAASALEESQAFALRAQHSGLPCFVNGPHLRGRGQGQTHRNMVL